MSTHCYISIKFTQPELSYSTIYCHNDGYPEHMIPILTSSYSTREKVAELVSLGDISFLGNDLQPQGPHSFDDPINNDTTIAYCRDRGDTKYIKTHSSTASWLEYVRGEYYYLYDFDAGAWYFEGSKVSDHSDLESSHLHCDELAEAEYSPAEPTVSISCSVCDTPILLSDEKELNDRSRFRICPGCRSAIIKLKKMLAVLDTEGV